MNFLLILLLCSLSPITLAGIPDILRNRQHVLPGTAADSGTTETSGQDTYAAASSEFHSGRLVPGVRSPAAESNFGNLLGTVPAEDSRRSNAAISSGPLSDSGTIAGVNVQGTDGTLPSNIRGNAFSQFSTSQAGTGRSGAGILAGGRTGTSSQVSRVQALITPTVTRVITVDRFITLTDQAFHSVAVTLTHLSVQTITTTTRSIVQTPVDDRVALQSTLIHRPTSLTVTCTKSYFSIVTDVSIDHVTITHTSYIISQVTYTTTVAQALTLTSTLVRTIVNTERNTVTAYQTITDTVLVAGGYNLPSF